MSFPWDDLRADDAPSELALDAYVAGEAEPEQSARVEAWAAASPANQAVLAARREASGPHPATRAKLLRALQPEEPWWKAWRWVFAPLAVAMSALFFVHTRPPPAGGLYAKGGGLQLSVFREGQREPLGRAAPLQAGERLRFRTPGPSAGYFRVVGVEASGALFPYAPFGPEALPASARDSFGAFPDSAVLDDSKGPERIVLVWCPTNFSMEQLGWNGALQVPEGCLRDSLEVLKR